MTTTTLYATETGFDRSAIMRRAHEIRTFWARSKWGAQSGDMGAALKRAWQQAKIQKDEATRRAAQVVFLATETPEARTARHDELAAQVAWARAA